MTTDTPNLLLAHMRGGRIATRSDMARAIGGTSSQISESVKKLLAAELIRRNGKTEKEPGKAPVPLFVLTPAGEALERVERPGRQEPKAVPFAALARLDLRLPASVFRMAEGIAP